MFELNDDKKENKNLLKKWDRVRVRARKLPDMALVCSLSFIVIINVLK